MQSLERLSIWRSRLGTEPGVRAGGWGWTGYVAFISAMADRNYRLDYQGPACLPACYKRI